MIYVGACNRKKQDHDINDTFNKQKTMLQLKVLSIKYFLGDNLGAQS